MSETSRSPSAFALAFAAFLSAYSLALISASFFALAASNLIWAFFSYYFYQARIWGFKWAVSGADGSEKASL